jgi:hypothetical protein
MQGNSAHEDFFIQKESDNLEDLSVDRRTISRITLKKERRSGENSFVAE